MSNEWSEVIDLMSAELEGRGTRPPGNRRLLTLDEYQASIRIEAEGWPFYALIAAAIRQADTENLALLRSAFPGIYDGLKRRYNAPGGVIPEDDPGGGASPATGGDPVGSSDRADGGDALPTESGAGSYVEVKEIHPGRHYRYLRLLRPGGCALDTSAGHHEAGRPGRWQCARLA